MSKRLYSHRRVKYWYCYDVDEICAIFKDAGLHPQTVRAWIKKGLKTIDSGKPALIYGNDLINYLKDANSKNKCKTAFEEMFCMRCQDARPVYQNHIIAKQQESFLQVKGVCRECKATMNKSYKLENFKQLQLYFRLVDVLPLYDCDNATDKTHIVAQVKVDQIESVQPRFSHDW